MMKTKREISAWQELSDRCGRIKAEDQHHRTIKACRDNVVPLFNNYNIDEK